MRFITAGCEAPSNGPGIGPYFLGASRAGDVDSSDLEAGLAINGFGAVIEIDGCVEFQDGNVVLRLRIPRIDKY